VARVKGEKNYGDKQTIKNTKFTKIDKGKSILLNREDGPCNKIEINRVNVKKVWF